ncbi:MAG: hypothetical protein ACE5I1_21105 [bacterium]
MRLNHYLPEFDYNEIHNTTIGAPPAVVYPLVRHLDFNASLITRILFKLRGLPANDLSLDAMLCSNGFSILEELPEKEIVIGGMANSKVKPVPIENGEQFMHFNERNGLKIAWNFALIEAETGHTKVSTETRVRCLGKTTKRKFAIYWFFIRPFSGLIRREMLRILRKQVNDKTK